ncbi:hypothetical protein NKG94_07960 [Micromonospora sp. M12]
MRGQLGELRGRRRSRLRYARVMPIVREHGAAVVALLIDEEGRPVPRSGRSGSRHG